MATEKKTDPIKLTIAGSPQAGLFGGSTSVNFHEPATMTNVSVNIQKIPDGYTPISALIATLEGATAALKEQAAANGVK